MNAVVNKLVAKPRITRCNTVVSLPRPVVPALFKNVQQVVKQPQTKTVTRQVQAQAVAKPQRQTISPEILRQSIEVQKRQRQVNAVAAASRAVASQAVVANRPRSLRQIRPHRAAGPRYITPDVTALDLDHIRNVAGIGKGRVLVIVGNGPSVAEIDPTKLRLEPLIDIMSINRPDMRVWPTRYWTFFDPSQLNRHHALWETYSGTIFNSTSIRERRPNTICLKNLGGSGFSFDLLKGMHIGRSSVYAAMQIGLWLGHEHVYILGCDMCAVGDKLHFYGINPDVSVETRRSRFGAEAKFYDEAAELMPEATRKKITFCTAYNPYSFVEKFNRIDHRVAVEEILDLTRRMRNGK